MALYRLAQAAAKRWPTAVALRSQTEALTLDFGTLERRAAATAAVLQSKGLEAGQVLISDLQNTSQNLVVQLACSSLGVAQRSTTARSCQLPAEPPRARTVTTAVSPATYSGAQPPSLASGLQAADACVPKVEARRRRQAGGRSAV